jgi:ribosomal protein S16
VLAIRLARIGKKKQPFYRIVVLDKRKPRNGRTVEVVGTYDPLKKPAIIQLDAERVKYWLSCGAQPSDTVRSFLTAQKIAWTASRPFKEGSAGPRNLLKWELESNSRLWIVEGPMKDLVEAIAKALVDHPEQVQVRAVDGEQVTVLELRVHPEDLGKVIGRQGRTAKSIRTILGAAGMKIRKRLTLEILE